MSLPLIKISDSKSITVVPSSPAKLVDKYWQVYTFWAEPVSTNQQSVIKWRKRNVTGAYEAIQTLDLGPNMKAMDPCVAAKGRNILVSFRGIDRANPVAWQIYEIELVGILPA